MQATYSVQFSSGGLSIGGNFVNTGDTNNPFEVPIPAAVEGELTTRTDDDTGIVTVNSHTILDTDTVDIYDSLGQLLRKDVDVTAVTGTTISLNAGSGSNLPALNSTVRVAKQTLISPVFFDASGIKIFGIELVVPGAKTQGRANFLSSVPASVGDKELIANSGIISNVAGGAANPLSGDAVSITASNGNATLDGVLKIVSLEDRTP